MHLIEMNPLRACIYFHVKCSKIRVLKIKNKATMLRCYGNSHGSIL